MSIKILPTDTKFTDSPDTGDIACICSRCTHHIREGEVPLRLWPDYDDPNFKEEDDYEYRFCENCMAGMGYLFNTVSND